MDDADDDSEDDESVSKRENKPMFFKHFKMALYGDGLPQREKVVVSDDDDDVKDDSGDNLESKDGNERNMAKYITSVDGRQYESSRVLQAALSFIKDEVMNAVGEPHDITSVDQIQV